MVTLGGYQLAALTFMREERVNIQGEHSSIPKGAQKHLFWIEEEKDSFKGMVEKRVS